jgi:hypothetical protein
MADLQQTLSEFIAAYEHDGATDPREYLSRVEGVERRELQALIESFLERAPQRAWDRTQFSGSIAERAVEAASNELEGAGWREVLPNLRNRAKLKRATVVERLAAALGFAESQGRVAAYYHRMEQGQLPPEGVSTKVLDALASILGTTGAALRRAGEAGAGDRLAGGEVFARGGAPERMALSTTVAADRGDADRVAPDELDRLFTGGE